MYAIVEIGGEQCKVTASDKIRVPKLTQEAGKQITIDRVLLVVDSGKASIGRPVLDKAVVKATVLAHDKDKKVMVFKKKRRKDYKVKKGHRQPFTELRIDSIMLGGKEIKKAASKKNTAAKQSGPAAAKPAAKTTAPKKTAAAKSPAEPAVKKTPVKKSAALKKTASPSGAKQVDAKPSAPTAKSKPDKTKQ